MDYTVRLGMCLVGKRTRTEAENPIFYSWLSPNSLRDCGQITQAVSGIIIDTAVPGGLIFKVSTHIFSLMCLGRCPLPFTGNRGRALVLTARSATPDPLSPNLPQLYDTKCLIIMPEMLSRSSESLLSTPIPKVQCTESCVMVFFSLLLALILLSCYASRCTNLLLVLFAFGLSDCMT